MILSITKSRKAEHLIVPALKKIGCHYLAFQMKSYYTSKGKYYDGSTTMRMTGNDCKRLEANIDTFLQTFLDTVGDCPEEFASSSATRLDLLRTAVQDFSAIANDLRSTTTTQGRVDSFSRRVEEWFRFCRMEFPTECTSRMPYMHILREHIAPLMLFWYKALGWGYGMFSCAASEHLNKRLQILECDHTSRKVSRFHSIIRSLRILWFHYPNSLFVSEKSKITCSACGQTGHNKKNRLCPHHSTVPEEFLPSDAEDSTGSS